MNWLGLAKRFLTGEHGSGSAFMIGMLPAALALSGLAIDGAAVFQEQGKLQATADAAALAAAADLPDVSKAAASAVSYAQKNMPVDSNGNVLAQADVIAGNWNGAGRVFTPAGTPINAIRVVVRRSAQNNNSYPTTFLSLAGIEHIDITAQATATAKQRVKAWVALVLDNTGSMCQPDTQNPCPGDTNPNIKINALKTASRQLITKLSGSETGEGDILVSIVPFTKDVNIGTAHRSDSWLSWSDFLAPPATPASNIGPNSNCPYSFGCQSNSTNGSSVVSKIPANGNICPAVNSLSHYYNGCFNSVVTGRDSHGNANAWSHTWIANDKSTWNGCITDRSQNFDTLNTTPSSETTNFVAENSTACPATSILPLSEVTAGSAGLAALNARIDAMQAGGTTNQTIGLSLGWQTLTQGTPFSPPDLPDGTQKFIVLLSDGYNTQNRWTGDGGSHSTAVDARMKAACDNIKAMDHVTVFTVFVDVNGSQGNAQVLQYCASNPSENGGTYYHLTSAGQIVSTFAAIGNQMTHLRLVD